MVRLRAVQNRQPPLRQIPSRKARKKRRASLRRPPRSYVKANLTPHTSRQLPRNPFFLLLCLLKNELLVSSHPLLESHLRRLARDLRPRRQDAQRSEPRQARRDGGREDVGAGVFDGAGSFHQRYLPYQSLPVLACDDMIRCRRERGSNQLTW